jgi:hypothetical protein
MKKRMTTSSTTAAQNPTTGENNKAWPISVALDQSTPDVPSCPRISALAMPTPMMDPISVVRARGRQAKVPGTEVPNNGGNQQGEYHGEAGERCQPAG